jgi:hypothetical protein
MEATGRLSGPELVCPSGSRYRAGDHVVTLGPGRDGRLVASQRAVIAAIDLAGKTLTLRTDEGQDVHLGIEDAGSDLLGYGYATTVHRCQGSTTQRAHLFADGGGRELAYVAMSRARHSTQVWTVADDLPQAVDDLRRDWSTRRTPTWAIDTALPDPATLTRERFQALPSDQQAHLAAVVHAETAIAGDAIVGIGLPDRAAALGQAEAALAQARQARADLETGTGRWEATETGRAVRDLAQARHAREQFERAAEHGARWRDCHAARKEAGLWAQRELDAQQRWEPTPLRPSLGSTTRSPSIKPASTGPPTISNIAKPPAERSSTTASNSNGTPGTWPNASTPSATTSTACGPLPRFAELPYKGSNSAAPRQLPSTNHQHNARGVSRCKCSTHVAFGQVRTTQWRPKVVVGFLVIDDTMA